MAEVQRLRIPSLLGDPRYRARCTEHGYKGNETASFNEAEDDIEAHLVTEHQKTDTPNM